MKQFSRSENDRRAATRSVGVPHGHGKAAAPQMLADHAGSADPDVLAPASDDAHSHPSSVPSAASGEGMVGQLASTRFEAPLVVTDSQVGGEVA